MSNKSTYALEVNDHLTNLLASFNGVKSQYVRRRGNAVSIDEETEKYLQAILYQMRMALDDLNPMKDEDLPDINTIDPNFDSYRSYLAFIDKIVSDETQEVQRALNFLSSYYGC